MTCVPGAAAGAGTPWRGPCQDLRKHPRLEAIPECSLRGGSGSLGEGDGSLGALRGWRRSPAAEAKADPRGWPSLAPQSGCAVSAAHVSGLRHLVNFWGKFAGWGEVGRVGL